MSDDLVERLRLRWRSARLCDEAADRIEELEAVLRWIGNEPGNCSANALVQAARTVMHMDDTEVTPPITTHVLHT